MLSEAQARSIAQAHGGDMRLGGGVNFNGDDFLRYTRAIEAAVLAEQAKQEPEEKEPKP